MPPHQKLLAFLSLALAAAVTATASVHDEAATAHAATADEPNRARQLVPPCTDCDQSKPWPPGWPPGRGADGDNANDLEGNPFNAFTLPRPPLESPPHDNSVQAKNDQEHAPTETEKGVNNDKETPISIPMLPPSPLPSQQCKDCNKMSTETGEDVNNDKGASTLQGIDDGDLKDGMVPRAFVA